MADVLCDTTTVVMLACVGGVWTVGASAACTDSTWGLGVGVLSFLYLFGFQLESCWVPRSVWTHPFLCVHCGTSCLLVSGSLP